MKFISMITICCLFFTLEIYAATKQNQDASNLLDSYNIEINQSLTEIQEDKKTLKKRRERKKRKKRKNRRATGTASSTEKDINGKGSLASELEINENREFHRKSAELQTAEDILRSLEQLRFNSKTGDTIIPEGCHPLAKIRINAADIYANIKGYIPTKSNVPSFVEDYQNLEEDIDRYINSEEYSPSMIHNFETIINAEFIKLRGLIKNRKFKNDPGRKKLILFRKATKGIADYHQRISIKMKTPRSL